MFATDFSKYFNCDIILSKFFRGVYAYDQIPQTIKVNEFYICNTENSNSEGKHWFVVCRPTKKLLECFDSLGTPLDKKDQLAEHIRFRSIAKIKFNSTQLQADQTDTCGYHCIYFAYQRLYNKDLKFKELLNDIYNATQLEANEEKIKHFINEIGDALCD